MRVSVRCAVATGLAMMLWAAGVRAAEPRMTADGLILVVNKQQPVGRALAEKYAAARGVPAGRIVEIDVPDGNDVAAAFYDKSIADVVRHEIETRGLREKTQCIVLFYGVPLRVRERDHSPAEATEAKEILDPMIATLRGQLRQSVEQTEAVARRVDPKFAPASNQDGADVLRARGVAAERAIAVASPKLDPAARQTAAADLAAARQLLSRVPSLRGMPTTKPTTMPSQQELNAWLSNPDDAEARRLVRETIYSAGNVFQLLMLCESQRRTLTGGEGEASLDSELSCLWAGVYPRAKWVPNPWHYTAGPGPLRQQIVRTCRIDGPTPEIAQRTFEDAIKVEADGLKGDILLDARGMNGVGSGPGSYESCDQAIRNVARYTAGLEDLKTIFDNSPGLMPDGSSAHAAIYCGWYSVRKYMPTARYVPGSVAWHVASYEMVTLRSPNEPGWCRNLMINGADVTLGPVGEPYLLAFPPADELLPLLFTGQMSVAEAYWASLPVTSWKMILIGDPLYRPFAKKPLITPDRLPPALRQALPES